MGQSHSTSDGQLSDDIFSPAANQRLASYFGNARVGEQADSVRVQPWAQAPDAFHLPRKFWETDTDTSSNLRDLPRGQPPSSSDRERHDSLSSVDAAVIHRTSTPAEDRLGIPLGEDCAAQDVVVIDNNYYTFNDNNYNDDSEFIDEYEVFQRDLDNLKNSRNYKPSNKIMDISVNKRDKKLKQRNPSSASGASVNTQKSASTKVSSGAVSKTPSSPKSASTAAAGRPVKLRDKSPNRRNSFASGPLARTESQSSKASSAVNAVSRPRRPVSTATSAKIVQKTITRPTSTSSTESTNKVRVLGRDPRKGTINNRWQNIVDEYEDTLTAEKALPKVQQQKEHRKVSRITNYRNFSNVEDVLNRKSSTGANRHPRLSDVETGSFTSSQSSTLQPGGPSKRLPGAHTADRRVSRVSKKSTVTETKKQAAPSSKKKSQSSSSLVKKKSLSNPSLASAGSKQNKRSSTKRSSKDTTVEEVAYDVVDEAIQRALKILYGSPKARRRSNSQHSATASSSQNARRRTSDQQQLHSTSAHSTSKTLTDHQHRASSIVDSSRNAASQLVNKRTSINNNISSSERRVGDLRGRDTSAMYNHHQAGGRRGTRGDMGGGGVRRTSIRPVAGSGRMSNMEYGPPDAGEYELNILPYEKEKENKQELFSSRSNNVQYSTVDQKSKTYIQGRDGHVAPLKGILSTNQVGSTETMHFTPPPPPPQLQTYTPPPLELNNNIIVNDAVVNSAPLDNAIYQQNASVNGPISSMVYPRPKTISKGSVTKVLLQVPASQQEEFSTNTWPLVKQMPEAYSDSDIPPVNHIAGVADTTRTYGTLPAGNKLTYLRSQGGQVDAIHEGATPLNLHLLSSMPADSTAPSATAGRGQNVNVFLHEGVTKSPQPPPQNMHTLQLGTPMQYNINAANINTHTNNRVDFLIDAGNQHSGAKQMVVREEGIQLPPIHEETELQDDYLAFSNEPIIVADLMDSKPSKRSRSRQVAATSDTEEYYSDGGSKLYASKDSEPPSVMMNTKQVLNMFLFNHPKPEDNGPSANYYMAQGMERRENGEIEKRMNLYMEEDSLNKYAEELQPIMTRPDPPDPWVNDLREINIYHKQTQTLPSPKKQIKMKMEPNYSSLPKETKQETTHYITREIERLPGEKVYISSQSVQTDNETDTEQKKQYSTKSLQTKQARTVESYVQTDTEEPPSAPERDSDSEMFEEDVVDTRYKMTQERTVATMPPLRPPKIPTPPQSESEEEVIEMYSIEEKEQKVSMAIFEELEFSFQRSEGGKITQGGSEIISMPDKLEPVVDRRKQKCTQIREVGKEGDFAAEFSRRSKLPAIEHPSTASASALSGRKGRKTITNHMESDGPAESDDSSWRRSGSDFKSGGNFRSGHDYKSDGDFKSGGDFSRDSLHRRSLRTLKNMPRPNINVYAQNTHVKSPHGGDDDLSGTEFLMQNFEYPGRSDRSNSRPGSSRTGSLEKENRRIKVSKNQEPFENGMDIVGAMKEWSSSLERKPKKTSEVTTHVEQNGVSSSTGSLNLRHPSSVDPGNVSFVKKYDPMDKLSEAEVLTLEQTRVTPTKPRTRSSESTTEPIIQTHLERDADGNIVKVTEVQQSVTKTFEELNSPKKHLGANRRLSQEELGTHSYVEMNLTDGEIVMETDQQPPYNGPEVLEEVTKTITPIEFDVQESSLKLNEDRGSKPKEQKYLYDMRNSELHSASEDNQERFFDPAHTLATHL